MTSSARVAPSHLSAAPRNGETAGCGSRPDSCAIRILFVDHSPILGGGQLALLAHLRHLDRSRFEPLVACTPSVPELVARYRAAGAEVRFIPLDRLRSGGVRAAWALLRSSIALRRLVARERIEVVVANTPRAGYVGAIALAGTGIPLVWWIRDFENSRPVFRLFRRAPRALIYVSRALMDFYEGSRSERGAVVHVGSDLHLEIARVGTERLARERSRWGIGADEVVVGFMGRLIEGKGPQDLIAAAGELREEFPRLRVLLVGSGAGQPGDAEASLRTEVEARGLSEMVVFTGFQADEAVYYRLFDVFVLSTRIHEAYATSVVQAMMARTPVVATDTGGTSELVRDGETGLLVPPASPPALAAALRTLLRDRGLAERLAEAGYREVMQRNREEVTTGEVARLFAMVAGRK